MYDKSVSLKDRKSDGSKGVRELDQILGHKFQSRIYYGEGVS